MSLKLEKKHSFVQERKEKDFCTWCNSNPCPSYYSLAVPFILWITQAHNMILRNNPHVKQRSDRERVISTCVCVLKNNCGIGVGEKKFQMLGKQANSVCKTREKEKKQLSGLFSFVHFSTFEELRSVRIGHSIRQQAETLSRACTSSFWLIKRKLITQNTSRRSMIVP